MEATFVKDLDNFIGTAKLWVLSEPITYDEDEETEYVATSAVDAPYTGPETYIFPCDEQGNVLSWGELPGSFRGSLDHDQAIARLLAPGLLA